MKSMFITLEGPEGGGKSTQAEILKAKLEAEGHKVLLTREPGGTSVGEDIRSILKFKKGDDAPTPVAELLLFEAARAQVVEKVIIPALARGEFVICDRYADSTMAYQWYGRGLNLDMINGVAGASCIMALNNIATSGLWPDLTLLLDIDPEVGIARTNARNNGKFDRFDAEGLAFHKRVRDAFLEIRSRDARRVRLIDASKSQDEVAESIWMTVSKDIA